MRIAFLAVALISCYWCNAQRTTDVTNGGVDFNRDFFIVGGEPVVNTKYTKLVDGTPYFKEDFINALVIFADNRQQKNVPVKIDLYSNEVHFLDSKGVERITSNQLKEIVLSDSIGDINYRFIHSSAMSKTTGLKEGWYLWLHSGNASLYKHYNKTISETKPYGSATYEQTIRTTESYLVHYNNALMEVKKIKEAPSVLANKKAQIEDYLKTKDNKNLLMDDRMVALIAYYNSLLK